MSDKKPSALTPSVFEAVMRYANQQMQTSGLIRGSNGDYLAKPKGRDARQQAQIDAQFYAYQHRQELKAAMMAGATEISRHVTLKMLKPGVSAAWEFDQRVRSLAEFGRKCEAKIPEYFQGTFNQQGARQMLLEGVPALDIQSDQGTKPFGMAWDRPGLIYLGVYWPAREGEPFGVSALWTCDLKGRHRSPQEETDLTERDAAKARMIVLDGRDA